VDSRLDRAHYVLASVGNHQLSGLEHGVDELCSPGAIIAGLLERQIVLFEFFVREVSQRVLVATLRPAVWSEV